MPLVTAYESAFYMVHGMLQQTCYIMAENLS